MSETSLPSHLIVLWHEGRFDLLTCAEQLDEFTEGVAGTGSADVALDLRTQLPRPLQHVGHNIERSVDHLVKLNARHRVDIGAAAPHFIQ